MKTILIAAVAALGFAATPALANDFAGVRAELTAGRDDATAVKDVTDVTYGVAVGLDTKIASNITVGVEANVDNVFDRRDIGASARVGYIAADNVLVYAKAGYANFKDVASRELDGLRVGGGVEVNVLGPIYTGLEYRYSDFEQGVGKHGGFAKVGVRF